MCVHFNSATDNNIIVFKLVDVNESTFKNNVVGHAELDILCGGDEVKISRIIVSEEYRGKGFGTEAMRILIKWIEDNIVGYKRICLTVFTFNAHAIAVYEKVGFTLLEVDHGFFQYGEEIWDRAKYVLSNVPTLVPVPVIQYN